MTGAAELGCQENFFFFKATCPFIQQVLYTQRKSRAGLIQTIKGRTVIIPSPELGYLPGGEDKNEESPHIAHHLVLEAMEKNAGGRGWPGGKGEWSARSESSCQGE